MSVHSDYIGTYEKLKPALKSNNQSAQAANQIQKFHVLYTAIKNHEKVSWHSVPRVQLAVIWSGIESLFNVNTEVSFRISLYIANFLGENEAQAQQIFKQVRKMYSSRSSAVHGNKTKDNLESAVEESANLLTRILRRCAELNKLPDVDNLAFRVDKQKQGIKCKMLVP